MGPVTPTATRPPSRGVAFSVRGHRTRRPKTHLTLTAHPPAALTRRVGLSILLFVLIVIGIATGILHPHGIYVR